MAVNPFGPEAADYYNKMAAAQMPVTIPGASDLAFQNQRQAVEDNYLSQRAQQQFQQGTAQSDFARRLRDLQYQAQRQRERMPFQMSRRGMYGNSGVWQRTLGDFLQMQGRQLGDVQDQQARTMGGFDVQNQTLDRQRLMGLAEVEAQRQALIAQLAARQFGGGN